MVLRILTVAVKSELDVLVSRQRARQITELCGFSPQDQVRIATVVSEMARNIYNYATSGKVEFAVSKATIAQDLVISVEDDGPGIDNLDAILDGRYQSKTGMGLGILGARRLMDHVDITTAKHVGTTIVLKRALPAGAPVVTSTMVGSFSAQLGTLQDNVALAEVRHQNQDLLETLAASKIQQEELQAVTQQLRATHETVVMLNSELEEKAAKLQKADVRKDEFLAILAHELRNPLAAAGMAASVLEAAPVSSERATQLGQIVSRQIGHMSRLVEDLIDVSKVTRGLVAIEKKVVDMRTIARTAVEQLGPVIIAKSHQLVLSLPDDECCVSGDATRLVQVGTNLIGNAVRYTPVGGEISVTLLPTTEMVTFQVTDNGQGIDPDLLPRLFDLYVQAERSTEGRTGGLGIGLTLVKSIAELHGGTVSATSHGKGLGSTFTINLPRLSA